MQRKRNQDHHFWKTSMINLLKFCNTEKCQSNNLCLKKKQGSTMIHYIKHLLLFVTCKFYYSLPTILPFCYWVKVAQYIWFPLKRHTGKIVTTENTDFKITRLDEGLGKRHSLCHMGKGRNKEEIKQRKRMTTTHLFSRINGLCL